MELKPLTIQDWAPLLRFEIENKAWFERSIPPRPAVLFTEKGMQQSIAGLLKEQRENKCYMNLIYEGDEVIGRANLNKIDGNVADLGYRVAEKAVDKGIATQAVTQLLDKARHELGITTVTATTTRDNIASQAVLEKLGFNQTHVQIDAAELNGKPVDLLFFECAI